MPEKKPIEIPPRGTRGTQMPFSSNEREEALARIAATAPRYAGYQNKTDREIPIIRLTPAA